MGLAAWRLSYMLFREEGPWMVFKKLRERFGVEHDEEGRPFSYPAGSVFACLGCLSVWVGILLFFFPRGVSVVLAVSTLAILIQEKFFYDG